MADIKFSCPHCGAHLEVDEQAAGMTVDCPHCNRSLVIPSPRPPDLPARPKVVGETIERLSDKVDAGAADVIKAFVSEQQEPAQVQVIFAKVSQVLTKEERIAYIAVQSKPVINVTPDAVVLTNRRFIVYRPKVLGRVDFEDYIWRDLADVRLKEGILGATITLQTLCGQKVEMDYLPKPQARRVYAIAQEMEERVREERRLRDMEEKRAAAGGVIIQGALPMPPGSPVGAAEDPVQKLKQLKDMLEAGLITQGEYEAKRQVILSRM
jgi:DNA-directed RNA polymerase subunit RPC12/RpoP